MCEIRDWNEIFLAKKDVIPFFTNQWSQEKGFQSGWSNFSEKLMLIVTELSEMTEAVDKVFSTVEDLLNLKDCHGILSNCVLLNERVYNYVEEWVDAMIRIMDLAGGCDLKVEVHGRGTVAYPTNLHDALTQFNQVRFQSAINGLSSAMEAYRDVRLTEDKIPLESEGNNNKLKKIEESLSSVLSQCAGACEDIGVNWESIYVEKMNINEKRPSKHGRER